MSGNWLAALSDPCVGKAFEAIHADPLRSWTLAELAKLAFQSRSAFASHFKATVGASPIYYLARWRMHLAAARLRRGREPISSIAISLGYVSDSAFSATFRRIMGVSPTQYRAEQARLFTMPPRDALPREGSARERRPGHRNDCCGDF